MMKDKKVVRKSGFWKNEREWETNDSIIDLNPRILTEQGQTKNDTFFAKYTIDLCD